MALQAAFIFLSPDADYPMTETLVKTDSVELTVVPVMNYAQATEVASDLTNRGIVSIELCGGFGNAGVAKISETVGDKASVGDVRFDCHSGLDGQSGNAIFAGN